MLSCLSEDPLVLLVVNRSRIFWLKVLFFLSGFACLVFEVLWTRLFSNIVGSTSLAMTCVFAVFITALSVGALLAARVRLQRGRALALYALLEGAIGLYGLLVTLLLLHKSAWLASLLGPGGGILRLPLQLAAALLIIGPPAGLMGATLPVMLAALKGLDRVPREEICLFYGANTLGAAFGALACGFLLIGQFGITGTAISALAVNALVCLGALAARPKDGPGADTADRGTPARLDLSDPLFPALALLSGLGALGYELLWGRICKLYLGDRTLAIASLLFIYLFCLAVGSFAADRAGSRLKLRSRKDVVAAFAAVTAAAAVLHLVALGLVCLLIPGAPPHFLLPGTLPSIPRVAAVFLAAFLPVTILGAAFPLLLRSAEGIDRSPAGTSGLLYGANTVGAAAGAVLGGYIIPATMGTLYGFTFLSILLGGFALLCFRLYLPVNRWKAAAGIVLACLFIAWLWLPSDLIFLAKHDILVFANEDEYGVQTVTRDPKGLMTLANNRRRLIGKLGLRQTKYAQESVAYYSCLLSRSCESVLDIGTGYGITAGAFTLFDEVKSLRTVELLPGVIEAQRAFRSHNYSYFSDPRVETVPADGRALLAAEDRRYDIISVNVLDPTLPGSSSLYTMDFWRLAKSRLAPGGVYSQLIWGPDIPLLVQGLKSVFPTVLFFPAYGDAYNILAFAESRPSPDIHIERISPKVRWAVKRFRLQDVEAFVRIAVDTARRISAKFDEELRDRPARTPHSDDRPVLEFRWSGPDQPRRSDHSLFSEAP